MTTDVALPVERFRRMLETQKPVTVIDMRDADEHQEWSVPGSTHADVYEDVVAGRASGLLALGLPKDRPVVLVCWRGQTSRLAASMLRAGGYDAWSLDGGMHGWSHAWNVADVAVPGSEAAVVQVRRTGKGCLSYVVVSGAEAAVIDPSVDASVYMEIAKAHGARVTAVLETHVHADHLSRAGPLAKAAGVPVVLPRTDRVSFDHKAVGDGDEVRVGGSVLKALRTPGHTPESTCYLLDGKALFSGDTVFVASIGRPDLEATPEGARARAGDLHASLARLLALDAAVLVLPCHTSRPVAFDRVPVAAPLRDVRSNVALLAAPRETFVAEVTKRLPPTPPNHHQIVVANEAGRMPPGDPADLEAGANRCAVM